jgi:hypothetical protein
LSGGDGEDTFVFDSGSGKDTITDFDVENDLLQIAKSKTIKNVADVIKHSTFKNGDVTINLGHGNKIVLKDVSKADFKANPDDHIVVVCCRRGSWRRGGGGAGRGGVGPGGPAALPVFAGGGGPPPPPRP